MLALWLMVTRVRIPPRVQCTTIYKEDRGNHAASRVDQPKIQLKGRTWNFNQGTVCNSFCWKLISISVHYSVPQAILTRYSVLSEEAKSRPVITTTRTSYEQIQPAILLRSIRRTTPPPIPWKCYATPFSSLSHDRTLPKVDLASIAAVPILR